MSGTRPVVAFAVAAAGIAVFSLMDAVMKGLTLSIGAYNALLWRSLAGVLIAGALHWWRRPAWPAPATLRLHAMRGSVGTVMALLFFWGLARVPMAQAVALTFIAPLIAIFFAGLLLGETVTKRAVLASVAASIGVMLILGGQAKAELGREALLGSGAVMLSAICYAYNIILMRRQSLAADALEVAFFQSLMVAGLLALGAPFAGVVPAGGHLPMLLFAAVLATASLLLLAWAYARAPASYLAPVEYTAFLWASLLGYLVFGEHVAALTIGGAVLIGVACFHAARAKPIPMANLEAAT